MAKSSGKKGIIGILTGGGDVPGLNPAIRAVTIRALLEGYKVIGIRRGWAGLIEIIPDPAVDNGDNFQILTEDIVNRAGRTGGTFLHTSRMRPSHVPLAVVPPHLRDKYTEEINDLTPEVLRNLDFLGIDYLIPIGGDDTLSYAVRLFQEGFKVVGIPKTMDNDVPGTDYCIGFSTCITRTLEMTHSLRTSAGSHERFLVIEVFGRYAGFTALLPTMAGAASRCVIPEYKFDIDRLTELLVKDRFKNPSRYSVVLVSEGAMFKGGEMIFSDQETDAYGHKKLGGIGEEIEVRIRAGEADASSNAKEGISVSVFTPEGKKIAPKLKAAGQSGEYLGSFVPEKTGTYTLRIETRTGSLEESILVTGALENQDAVPDHNRLRKISESTGGKFLSGTDDLLKEVENYARQANKPFIQEKRFSIWNSLWLLILIGACLSVEWYYRRRGGLV